MEKEELILDIVEKTYDQLQTVKVDIVDIKIQQAVHDSVVKEHSARSTQLENRAEIFQTELLEMKQQYLKDKAMINGAVKIIIALGTVIAFLVKILPYLSAHL